MPAFVKFQDFTEQLVRGTQDFDAHTYKVALTNTAPVATQTAFDSVTNHPAPVAANGYTAGGYTTTITLSETGGVTTVQGTQVVITASGGQIGPFRYAILYNSTNNNLVGYSDYGSSITLNDTEPVTIKFNNASPGTIFTLT